MNKFITSCGCCGIKVCTLKTDTDPFCAECFAWAKALEYQHKDRIFTRGLAIAWDSLEDTQRAIEDNLAVFQENGIAIDASFERTLKTLSEMQTEIVDLHLLGAP